MTTATRTDKPDLLAEAIIDKLGVEAQQEEVAA